MYKNWYLLLFVVLISCTAKHDHDHDTEMVVNLQFDNVHYLSQRTALVARVGNNFLVRGNLPIDPAGNFVYDSIIHFIETQAPGILTSSHWLIDVSMIDNRPAGELPELQNELKGYGLANTAIPDYWPPFSQGYVSLLQGEQVNGHNGRFFWWPIEGYSPRYSWNDRMSTFITGGYNFDGLVDKIDSLFRDTSQNRIIYYHCTWGADRTGALTYGWLVKHGGYSRDSALAKVNSVTIPNDNYRLMIDDYQKYLDSVGGKRRTNF